MSSRRGSAVALSLVCVTIVAGFAVAFLRVSTSASRRQTSEVENQKAFYLAEAGLAEAFNALRIGRTGQVGSEEAPAAFGNGLLWVDAVENGEGQVQLESTALVGTGRATLALMVEPVELPLGFFSDEELVVDSVLMVDGYNSDERTYTQELAAIAILQEYAEELAARATMADLVDGLEANEVDSAMLFAAEAEMNEEEVAELVETWPDLVEAYDADLLFPDEDPDPVVPEVPIELTDPIVELPDLDPGSLLSGLFSGAKAGSAVSPPANSNAGGSSAQSEPTSTPSPYSGPHTASGGMLGSNGDVQFNLDPDESVAIYGDIVPGPNGTISGLDGVSVNGDTDSRTDEVELPAVEVPAIALEPALRHDDLLPLVIPTGDSGYASIEVAADAELIINGPAVVVFGELVVEPGATLTFDTRNGDIALYITDGLDLQSGSITTTTSEFADELTVQVSQINSTGGQAPVKLDSTSQFHGTIYSPETEVYVGSGFEVYGGIVARKLGIGPGARLHFDNSGFEGSPIPRLLSWRIVEIKNAAKNRSRNVFKALGLEPGAVPELSKAHDLTDVTLRIQYINLSGQKRTFVGSEAGFDWTQVDEVLVVARVAARPHDPQAGAPKGRPNSVDPEPVAPDPSLGRTDVLDAIAGLTGVNLKDELLSVGPLNDAELKAVLDAQAMTSTLQLEVLEASAPFSDEMLEYMIQLDSGLPSSHLKQFLVDQSPLSPSVLSLVQSGGNVVLSIVDKLAVLLANGL